MAEAIHFHGANFTFKAPEGREDIVDLHTFRQPNGAANVSCWRLAADELEEVNRTGCVWHSVMSGRIFYPAFVGSETTVRGVVADYGAVWECEAQPEQAAGRGVTQVDRDAASEMCSGGLEIEVRKGHCDGLQIVQLLARHRWMAMHAERKRLIADGCIHTRKAAEHSDDERPDLIAWQTAQSEWFAPVILEIVSEYATWRDRQSARSCEAALELTETLFPHGAFEPLINAAHRAGAMRAMRHLGLILDEDTSHV